MKHFSNTSQETKIMNMRTYTNDSVFMRL